MFIMNLFRSSNRSSKIDGNLRTKKIGPPPLKPGVDYINPQEEDQMVCSFIIHNDYFLIHNDYFLIHNDYFLIFQIY